ncbi:MAG: hypothetical protein IJ567_06255 [Lachnospiraceae bacterium]|nr:hypothetical protein [Lachnospiraceae bacterium]
MKYEELQDGMKVIDTDDGMVMEYQKTEQTDFFCSDKAKWHVCQFDLSTFEPYAGELKPGQLEKRK